MLNAALKGAGLAYPSQQAVALYLGNRELVQVRMPETPPHEDLCLYYSGRRHVPAKLREFMIFACCSGIMIV
ncbi:hypothetical protein [Ensifer aridi]|uniref:hypothetical protein n=1 Tax=Ensifer aridi TaxID=1708715 RepID=UPI000A117C8F|nr:hypothetical protein [Ensifer aridi]